MSHTPGPWTIHKVPAYICTDFYAHIHGAGEGYFTPCAIYNDGKMNEGLAQANAHLIAAAPEMLKVLKGIISHNDALKPGYKLSYSLIAHVQEAITNAEGKG